MLSWTQIGNIYFLSFEKWSDGINVQQPLDFHESENISVFFIVKNKTCLPFILNNDTDMSNKLACDDICEEFENNRDNENIVCGITKEYKIILEN